MITVRTPATGSIGNVFRAVGVALPPNVAEALCSASVTGLDESIPLLRRPAAGVLLLYGVVAWPPPDGV